MRTAVVENGSENHPYIINSIGERYNKQLLNVLQSFTERKRANITVDPVYLLIH